MKTLVFIVVFFGSLGISAEEVDCRQVKDRMVLFCEAVVDQCDFLQNCLVRRDTCVDGAPKNEQDCSRLNTCMKAVTARLPDREKCDYKWTGLDQDNFCRVDSHFLFFEESCPGNIDGIFTAMAYGLNAVVDSKFTCKAVHAKYGKKVDICSEYRQKFAKSCMVENSEEDRTLYDRMVPKKCEEYDKFANYPKGYHYLPVEGIEQNSSNRGLPVDDPSFKSLGRPNLRNVLSR